MPLPAGALGSIRERAETRRRRRAIGTTSGVVVLVVAIALAAGSRGSRQESLDQLPPSDGPTRSVDTGGLPWARPTPPPPPALGSIPLADRLLGPHDVTAMPAVVAPHPTGRNAGAAKATPQPMRSYDADAVRPDATEPYVPFDCGTTVGTEDAPGWCLSASGTPSGKDERLTLFVCRSRIAGPAELDWTTSQQVGFRVQDSRGAVVWTYHPLVRPLPESQTVLPGDCVHWRFDWPRRTDGGANVRAGSHELQAWTTEVHLHGIVESAHLDVP